MADEEEVPMETCFAGNMVKVHRVSDNANGYLVEMRMPGMKRSVYDFYEDLEKAEAAIAEWNGKEMEPLTEDELDMYAVFEFYNSPEVESGWV